MAVQTYVIVGGGVAGASAAEALRGAGFDGRIVLVGDEHEQPYERPPLSKGLLRGEVAPDSTRLRSPSFYELNSIELHLNDPVSLVDHRTRRIGQASGARIDYVKLLIATGGAPRRLNIPGSELPGVHYLRTLEQALALRKDLEHQPRVLVVGTGFIGCEVAASAKQIGCEVTLAGLSLPMAHALGHEVGAIYADYHRSHGVQMKIGSTVTAFRGGGSLEEALLSDGSKIACTVALIGIGIDPSFEILREVDTHDGLATDEFCQTNIENVYAAGDVARSWRPRLGRHVRMEHFDNAQLQGAAAAQSMCGKMLAYDPIPFFWSDQYEFGLQYYGHAVAWDDVVVRGRPNEGSFSAFFLQGGRLDGVCAINRSKDTNAIKRLLGQRAIPAQRLADDGVPLESLVAPRTHIAR